MKTLNLCVIDLSAVFHLFWHASEQEEVNKAQSLSLQAVESYVGDYDAVAIAIDMPPYKRREIDPLYKAQREHLPTVFHEQMRQTIDKLEADGNHIFGVQGYEADDIIATICEWSESQAHHLTIYSADKDLMQLVSPNTHVISTATRDKYDEAKVEEKFGVPPCLISDLLALIGDKSDNIPGIKGVGPKTASKWLQDYAGLGGVLAHAKDLGRFAEVVEASKEQISKWHSMTLLMKSAPIEPAKMLTPRERKQTEQKREYEGMETQEVEVVDAPKTAEKSDALVVKSEYAPTTWDKALEPRDPRQAWGLANSLFQSKMFGGFPNPEAILAVVMTGRAFGMDAVASLRGFHVIKGKVSPSAQLLIGLVKRHPACEYFRFVEGDDKHATWETKRKDEPEPTRMSYTFEQAKRAQLASNDQWVKRPETMLRWRAGTELARVVFPDICAGLCTVEELDDEAKGAA
jgi:5'-3' exonuclease